ncbi:metalloregulator ArsR/SmtB family transcription factor [Sphingobium sp.]|uniref:metalloregulator ArsR/SmtB family transcription factor n=1 Tax=Sphingobium sp. TaxID=1912891 RepID=UPI003B3A306F
MDKIFKALASEPRRRILHYLAQEAMTVGEIADNFEMAMPSISKHLGILKDAGVVREQKRGQYVLYMLAADQLADQLYDFLAPFCDSARQIVEERPRKRRRE